MGVDLLEAQRRGMAGASSYIRQYDRASGKSLRITLENLPELRRALNEMSRESARRVFMEPLREGAKVIQSDARLRAPRSRVHRGPAPTPTQRGRPKERLADSIIVEPDFRALDRGRIQFLIGPTNFYGLFQEFGWVPKGPGARKESYGERKIREGWQGGVGYKAQRRRVGIGLAGGQAYLRPAFDMNKEKVVRQCRDALDKRLREVVANNGLATVRGE